MTLICTWMNQLRRFLIKIYYFFKILDKLKFNQIWWIWLLSPIKKNRKVCVNMFIRWKCRNSSWNFSKKSMCVCMSYMHHRSENVNYVEIVRVSIYLVWIWAMIDGGFIFYSVSFKFFFINNWAYFYKYRIGLS